MVKCTWILAAALLAAGGARAETTCATGVITVLQHASGGDSLIRIKTATMPAANGAYQDRPEGRMVEIWYRDSSLRWLDRFKLLMSAYVQGQRIVLTSSDGNCMGPVDEFEVRVDAR